MFPKNFELILIIWKLFSLAKFKEKITGLENELNFVGYFIRKYFLRKNNFFYTTEKYS